MSTSFEVEPRATESMAGTTHVSSCRATGGEPTKGELKWPAADKVDMFPDVCDLGRPRPSPILVSW